MKEKSWQRSSAPRKNESIYFTGSGGSLRLAPNASPGHLGRCLHGYKKNTARQPLCLLAGERFDGHSFASQAAKLGAAALLVDHPVDADVPQLVVTDTGKALLQLAGWYRRRFQLPVVGLTGSVGKTTTKEFIALVLGAKYNTLKTQGNLNNEIGVPQMLFRLEDSHTAAVIEMGMNHFGEISRLTRAVAPTVGLITNIGVSHIENLGSRAGILQAKLEILEGMAPDAPLIVNMDNDMLRTVKLGDRPLLTFAIDDQSADFTATDIAEQGSTTTFTVHHSTFTQPVTIPTVGIHNVYNALAAMAVGPVCAKIWCRWVACR